MGKKYLLDTHALIWYQGGNSKLSKKLIQLIQNKDNEIFFSQISLIEIAVKQKIGKLPSFKVEVENIYFQAIKDGFTFMDIINQHITAYQKVPLYEQHRDPFDRLLIASAFEKKADIITIDSNFSLYPELVNVVWLR